MLTGTRSAFQENGVDRNTTGSLSRPIAHAPITHGNFNIYSCAPWPLSFCFPVCFLLAAFFVFVLGWVWGCFAGGGCDRRRCRAQPTAPGSAGSCCRHARRAAHLRRRHCRPCQARCRHQRRHQQHRHPDVNDQLADQPDRSADQPAGDAAWLRLVVGTSANDTAARGQVKPCRRLPWR